MGEIKRPYKINYEVDSDGYLLSWQECPFDEEKPYVECEVYPELIVGVTMVIDGHFVTDFERRAALMEKMQRIDTLSKQLNEEYIWFDQYDVHVAEYNREIRLGIEPSVDISTIDAEAEVHRATIRQIRKELEELEG